MEQGALPVFSNWGENTAVRKRLVSKPHDDKLMKF